MKINEIVGGDLKSFVAVVRCDIEGMGSSISRIQIRCDGQNQARYLLTRCYGRGNVLSIQQSVDEGLGVIKPIKPLTLDQLQVKGLEDQAKAMKHRAKQVKAQQKVKRDQAALAKVNRSLP